MVTQSYKPAERGAEQILGHRQASVLEYLWNHGPQTPGDLHQALVAQAAVAYTTIHTELGRLVKKGFVKKGRGDSVYAAALTRDEFKSAMVAHVLAGLIDAHGAAAIHGFVDLVAADKDAYNELQRALKNKKIRRLHRYEG